METQKIKGIQVELSEKQIYLLNIISEIVSEAQNKDKSVKEIPLIDGDKLVLTSERVSGSSNEEESEESKKEES